MSHVVPLLDLGAQFVTIREEINAAIERVIESQQFILGPEVEGLERELAEYCRANHSIGCSSGTDALLLALMAFDIGHGDEVVTTPYSFFATAGVIHRLGARPVFVDIDEESFNIDAALVAERITPHTKAILPVHLFGRTADMGLLARIAERHGIPVIEDACQAIGASYRGWPTGTLGRVAAFSFFPTKNLGGFGDGGMVVTNYKDVADKIRRLRVHGMEPKYFHHEVGINGRLDALQATVLRVKLRYLDSWTATRQAHARCYATLFAAHGLGGWVRTPLEPTSMRHVFNQYVIRVPAKHRDALRTHLAERGVGSEVYYPVPLHLQECFAIYGYKPGDFPNSERAAAETVALPVYPEMTPSQQMHVVTTIAEYAAAAGHKLARRAA